MKNLPLLLALSCSGTHAGTVAGFGGSTEITQLMNNVQLIASAAKQAAMVSEQIKSNITTLQQYATMATNLKNLPQELLGAAIGPYQSQLHELKAAYQAVDGLYQSANDASRMFSRRLNEMQAMALPPKDYLAMESALAARKGGAYERQMRSDLAAINNLQQRAEQLHRLSEQNRHLSGNLQGLQLLNQQANMLTGEMMELKAAILQQGITDNRDRADRAFDQAITSEKARRNAILLGQKDARNKELGRDIHLDESWGP